MLALLAWISNHVDEKPEKRESAAVLEDSVQPSRKEPLEKARKAKLCVSLG